MSDREYDDPVERLLRADALVELEDGGFSDRVLRMLPGPGAAARTRLRAILILGSTALGSALAASLGSLGPVLVQGFADLVAHHALTPQALTTIAMAATLAIAGYLLAAEAD